MSNATSLLTTSIDNVLQIESQRLPPTDQKFTCDAEAKAQIATLVMMKMKQMIQNAQELLNNSAHAHAHSQGHGHEYKQEVFSVDTIADSYRLTFPIEKCDGVYDQKTGKELKAPQGVMDTLAAYMEFYWRYRVELVGPKLKPSCPSWEQAKFMQQNKVLFQHRDKRLFTPIQQQLQLQLGP